MLSGHVSGLAGRLCSHLVGLHCTVASLHRVTAVACSVRRGPFRAVLGRCVAGLTASAFNISGCRPAVGMMVARLGGLGRPWGLVIQPKQKAVFRILSKPFRG